MILHVGKGMRYGLNEEKVDIGNIKVDIQDAKVDIEKLL